MTKRKYMPYPRVIKRRCVEYDYGWYAYMYFIFATSLLFWLYLISKFV